MSFLGEMQRVAFSPIAIITHSSKCVRTCVCHCVCVHVYICVSVSLVGGPQKNGLKSIRHFSTICRRQITPSNYIFSNIVAHDLDLLFKVKASNRDQLCRFNMIISKTVTGRANLTIATTKDIIYCPSTCIFRPTFDLSPVQRSRPRSCKCQLKVSILINGSVTANYSVSQPPFRPPSWNL